MAVKNKTVEIQKQEAYEEGFEQGSSVTRESIGGYKEYNVGREITKALYQLREQIAQEIEASCQKGLGNYCGVSGNYQCSCSHTADIARGK